MNRNTAITITVIIAIAIIAWSLAMRSDTAQDEYPVNSSSPTLQTIPQEDISVDSSIDSDIDILQQELEGI